MKILTAILLLLTFNPAWAETWQDEYSEAYKNGDYETTLNIIKPRAVNGDVRAQLFLAFAYDAGTGIPVDYVESLRWATLAAKKGFAPAQSYLGIKYSAGKGVLQDHLRAYMWLNLASSLGSAQATEGRDLLSKILPREQLLEAQKMSRECLATNYKRCD